MSLADTRPPWLFSPTDLETHLLSANYTLPLLSLRSSRHTCALVQQLLEQNRTSRCDVQPSDFELKIAKQHLAVELQQLLRRWVEEGLETTVRASFLQFEGQGQAQVVPAKRRSEDEGRGGGGGRCWLGRARRGTLGARIL